uniref:Pseudouridine synthase RsuA/RluA-like domain-containing protein n=1 Tax=Hyaloperonospora arabidopsidis (strain Emoy2) TaxID=559515 RepID=M4B2W7_HYAAE
MKADAQTELRLEATRRNETLGTCGDVKRAKRLRQRVVHQDAHFVVLDKPQGLAVRSWVVAPASKQKSTTTTTSKRRCDWSIDWTRRCRACWCWRVSVLQLPSSRRCSEAGPCIRRTRHSWQDACQKARAVRAGKSGKGKRSMTQWTAKPRAR